VRSASAFVISLTAGALAIALSSCDSVGDVCDPGSAHSCSCGPAGPLSTETCLDDGTGWAPCDCPGADGDGDVDGDVDGDSDGDADGDSDGDADEDGDVELWSPTESCGATTPTEERWLVVDTDPSDLRGYLTGRDCSAPELLCTECLPTAISPSGDRALVVLPAASAWRLHDDLAVVDLVDPAHPMDLLGVQGSGPAWVDDERFLYLAPSPLTPTPCETGEVPERNDLRLFDLRSGRHELVAESLRRAWRAGPPVPSGTFGHVALSEDFRTVCREWELNVAVLDVATSVETVLPWTVSMQPDFVAGGLLPDGSGYLVQQGDERDWTSRLYVVAFDGSAQNVYPVVDGFGARIFGYGLGLWPACAAVRRLGPACELYCHGHASGISRLTLYGDPPEPVDCSGLGEAPQIMDVWQR